MARMIPSVISPDTKSTAEKRIFKWFSEAEGTDNWIVLHSLGLAKHVTLIHGEIDFLVIAPNYGVFALEVKGGRVKREDGMWFFTNKEGATSKKSRGPFEQAWDGIHSVMGDRLKEKLDSSHLHISNLLYGIGVMFPDIEYENVGVDEETWQVFDCNDGNNVKDFIIRLSNGAKEKWKETYGFFSDDKLPTNRDAKYLAGILRADFDKAVAMRAKIRYAEQELLELTQEQYKCLDQLEENRRGIIYGPAGTGKTLLAVEEAKKKTLMNNKVALFCYNNSLGQWYQDYFETAPEAVKPDYIGTFHGFLMKIVKGKGKTIEIPNDEAEKDSFYSETLPFYAMEVLMEDPCEFDEIIIDEAQDLITDNYIDIFDLIIKKGFDHGNWKFFGDFTRQAIYADTMTAKDMFEFIESKTSFIRYKLTINCRNTKQICSEIQTVTGFEPPSELWSKIEGIPVEYNIFADLNEEYEKLKELLERLNSKNIDASSITILSPYRREKSVVDVFDKRIKDFSFKSTNCITFSTIQSFKGLENTIIILVDIDNINLEQLMYVALSRARTGLFVFLTNDAKKDYDKLFARRLLNGR